jgi:hypothetical protein
MSATFQLSFEAYASGSDTLTVYPAILDTPEFYGMLARDNRLSDMCWQVPARGWPGAATDMTSPLFTRDLPPVELNKLVYPSGGVTRWGYIYCMFTGTQIEAIKNDPSGRIVMQTNDTASPVMTFENMTLVATMPLYEVGSNYGGRVTGVVHDSDTLHLALFADERFWMANYAPSVDFENVPGDWGTLLTGCLIALSTVSNINPTIPTIDTAFGTPSIYSDWMEMFQYNSAMMLDAAVYNVGLVLIRDTNGNYHLRSTEDAAALEDATQYTDSFLRAGGEWSRNGRHKQYLGSMPNAITVHFPIWDATGASSRPTDLAQDFPPSGAAWQYQWNNDEGLYHLRSPLNSTYYYPVEVTLAASFTAMGRTPPSTPGLGTKIFRETAKACGESPTNLTILQNLAKAVASNYYLGKLYSLRQETWNSFIAPSGSGFYTYVYYMGLDTWTKIIGDPANDEVEQLMHDVECDESESGSESSSESEGSSSGACFPAPAWMRQIPGFGPNTIPMIDANGCITFVGTDTCAGS